MDVTGNVTCAAICGATAFIFGIVTVGTYHKYKKAKRRYEAARKLRVLNPGDVLKLDPATTEYVCVRGWAEKVTQSEQILSFTYQNFLIYPSFKRTNFLTNRTFIPFFVKGRCGNKLYVYPSGNMRMTMLNRHKYQPATWGETLRFLVLRGGILTGVTEYFCFNGDHITLFGTLKWDITGKKIILFSKYVSSSGLHDILKSMKETIDLENPVMIGILFAAFAGFAAYFGYKAYKNRRR